MPCHGVDGHGDGRLAQALKTRPADLTRIAKANQGEFPTKKVADIIDGRAIVAMHGPREMPVWATVTASILSQMSLPPASKNELRRRSMRSSGIWKRFKRSDCWSAVAPTAAKLAGAPGTKGGGDLLIRFRARGQLRRAMRSAPGGGRSDRAAEMAVTPLAAVSGKRFYLEICMGVGGSPTMMSAYSDVLCQAPHARLGRSPRSPA
jgi:hypothetical protein